jgi:hypothetical protein
MDDKSNPRNLYRSGPTVEAVDGCSTVNTAIASYLLARGYQPTVEFRFLNAGLQREIDMYDAGQALVEPKQYEKARRRIQRAQGIMEGESQ